MVFQDEHDRRDTTLTSMMHDEDLDRQNVSIMSCCSNARDASTSPRDALEELRQNHTSILNITSDGEESDDDDASQSSFLFADLNEPPQLDDDYASTCHGSKALVTSCPAERSNSNVIIDWFDTSSDNIRNVTESFTESLCPGALSEVHPCRCFERYLSTERSLQHQMELDIFAILGCTDPSNDDELDIFSMPLMCPLYRPQMPLTTSHPRIQRIQKFRKKRIPRKIDPIRRSHSLDSSLLNNTNTSSELSFHDAVASYWGFEDEIRIEGVHSTIENSAHQDGYDSDPGNVESRDKMNPGRNQNFESFLDVSAVSNEVELGLDALDLVDVVQETMNLTWSLTWHPTRQNMETLGFPDLKKISYEPSCIQLWFERGNILNNGKTIIEPQVMWRQGMTCPNQIVKAHHIRLLSICRVLPVLEMDRSMFPFARTATSFIVRTIVGDDFLFEARSKSDRDLIVQRWKLVVTRLATLAVFQDIVAMQNEFFSSDPTMVLS